MFGTFFAPIRLAIAPYLLAIKIGLLVLVLLLVAWGAWYVRGALSDRQINSAVNTAVNKVQKDLDEERKLRSHYQTLVDTRLSTLLDAIKGIKVEHITITRNITKEREIHREFYLQALPAGGYEEWKRARNLIESSPASSPQR